VPALRAEKEQQHGAIGQRCVDRVPDRSGRERPLSRGQVLALVARELLHRLLDVGGSHVEPDVAIRPHQMALDADSSQNQHLLPCIGKPLEPANFD
jgi:hypothetical protein